MTDTGLKESYFCNYVQINIIPAEHFRTYLGSYFRELLDEFKMSFCK